MMNDTILKTVSELRQQLDEKVADIKSDERMEDILKIHKTIVTLEELAEVPVTSLGDVFGFTESNVTIRRDEFYGLTPLEAAKRFIKKRGRACTLDEIAKGIQSGGCHDFKEEDLGESLSRSTLAIAKVGNELYGLVEFYPHIKRERKRKSTEKNGSAMEVQEEPGESVEVAKTTEP
jgi:hypothetical protein